MRGDAICHAFEPNHQIYDILNLNVRPYDNIRAHHMALGSKKEIKYIKSNNIFTMDNPGGSSTTHDKLGSPVLSVTLDSLNIPNVGFVKVDVEGDEWEVLLGAKKTLTTYHPPLVCEILGGIDKKNYTPDDQEYASSIIDAIGDMGYSKWKYISPHDVLFIH